MHILLFPVPLKGGGWVDQTVSYTWLAWLVLLVEARVVLERHRLSSGIHLHVFVREVSVPSIHL